MSACWNIIVSSVPPKLGWAGLYTIRSQHPIDPLFPDPINSHSKHVTRNSEQAQCVARANNYWHTWSDEWMLLGSVFFNAIAWPSTSFRIWFPTLESLIHRLLFSYTFTIGENIYSDCGYCLRQSRLPKPNPNVKNHFWTEGSNR